MPKRFISKYLPKASTVTRHRSLSWLGSLLHESNLWHLNRRSVASAVFVGVFVSFLPIPLQMLVAASLAIFLRCNLPISIALTWVSNPLTYAPIYYLSYRFGLVLIGQEYDPTFFEWRIDTMAENLTIIFKPLIVGCTVGGFLFAGLGYMLVRLLWRFHIQISWVRRKSIASRGVRNSLKLHRKNSHKNAFESPSTKTKASDASKQPNKLPTNNDE